MTSHVILVLAANAALLWAGVGFLLLIDAWRHLGRWNRFAVALLTGQALFLMVAPLLLLARLSVSPTVALPLIAAVLVAGFLTSRRRRSSLPSPFLNGKASASAPLATAIVAAPLIVLAVGAVVQPLYQIDAMLNWVMKAKVIWAGGRHLTGVLDHGFFARPDLHPQAHLEYPLGLNALLAWSFHWMGSADIRVMHLQLVLLLAAAVGTWWAMLRPVVPDLPLGVALAGLIMMPAVVHHLLTAYADVPLALVWVTGALMLIRWAAESAQTSTRPSDAPLCGFVGYQAGRRLLRRSHLRRSRRPTAHTGTPSTSRPWHLGGYRRSHGSPVAGVHGYPRPQQARRPPRTRPNAGTN